MKISIARKFTCKLIDQAEEGITSWETIARSCMNYMSEADVQDMAESEELIYGMQEGEEDEE